MAQYAIAFDLDTTRMEADKVTAAQRTAIYQKEIPEALEKLGFTAWLQGSIYATKPTERASDASLSSIMRLQSALRQDAPNFCKYVKRVHVFRMDEWSDVTGLLSKTPDGVPTTTMKK